jgi:putative FmdB family regulatory protein
MPTYDYRCTRCKHRFELFHGITDDRPKSCPRCKSRAVRVPAGGAGLLFKGSGFYITDHRSKSYREKARQEKTGEGTSGGEKKPSGDTKSSKGS